MATDNTKYTDVRASSATGQIVAAAAPIPSPLCDIIAALRTIVELEGLTEQEYAWIANHGTERVGPDGCMVFIENEPSHDLTFLLKGEVYVHRRNAGPVALFFGRAGRMTGKVPYSRMKYWGGDGRASGEFWGLDVHESEFPAMLQAIPSMAQRSVSVLLDRVREFARADEQGVKLTALGKLAANLAHELNNPASAARRAAGVLSSGLQDDDPSKYQLGYLCESKEELAAYCAWVKQARSHISLSSTGQIDESDREDAHLAWLEAHNIPAPWTISPTLAEAALPVALLDQLAATVRPEILPLAIGNFAAAVRSERAACTIMNSTSRIFDIVAAVKDYSYMDQAPIQEVNLAQSLETTLSMMRPRLDHVTIEREFDPHLPLLRAFGSELNEVWMALIENALDAVKDHGRLKLSAKLKGRMVFVEVWDDGPGIDPELTSRIFEPFFTTKPIGAGLGLGLDLVQRVVSKHFGSVSVESRPASTCFQVRLPIDRTQVY